MAAAQMLKERPFATMPLLCGSDPVEGLSHALGTRSK